MNSNDQRMQATLYIQGVARKPSETVVRALQKIHGIGPVRARQVCMEFGRSQHTRLNERTNRRREARELWMQGHWSMESNRRREISERIQWHMKVGSLRGIRMRQGRPVRGQRTATNAQTAKRLNARRG